MIIIYVATAFDIFASENPGIAVLSIAIGSKFVPAGNCTLYSLIPVPEGALSNSFCAVK